MTTRIRRRAAALCVVCDPTAVTDPNRWYTTECYPSQLVPTVCSQALVLYTYCIRSRACARKKVDDLLKGFGRGLTYFQYFLTDFSGNLRIPSPIIPPNTHKGG